MVEPLILSPISHRILSGNPASRADRQEPWITYRHFGGKLATFWDEQAAEKSGLQQPARALSLS